MLICLFLAVLKEPLQRPNSQVSSMFAVNDDKKKFYTDEPAASIFDGPTIGRALTFRSSCTYPGSIVDQLRSSRTSESFGTPRTSAVVDTGRHIVGTSSDTVVPSGDQNESNSSCDADDSNNCQMAGITVMSEAQNSAGSCNKDEENSNPAAVETPTADVQVKKIVVRRQKKKTEFLSSTDSESDTEVLTSEYGSKSKASRSKPRKRRKKLTVNLAGTRYDVGKR